MHSHAIEALVLIAGHKNCGLNVSMQSTYIVAYSLFSHFMCL